MTPARLAAALRIFGALAIVGLTRCSAIEGEALADIGEADYAFIDEFLGNLEGMLKDDLRLAQRTETNVHLPTLELSDEPGQENENWSDQAEVLEAKALVSQQKRLVDKLAAEMGVVAEMLTKTRRNVSQWDIELAAISRNMKTLEAENITTTKDGLASIAVAASEAADALRKTRFAEGIARSKIEFETKREAAEIRGQYEAALAHVMKNAESVATSQRKVKENKRQVLADVKSRENFPTVLEHSASVAKAIVDAKGLKNRLEELNKKITSIKNDLSASEVESANANA